MIATYKAQARYLLANRGYSNRATAVSSIWSSGQDLFGVYIYISTGTKIEDEGTESIFKQTKTLHHTLDIKVIPMRRKTS